MKAALETTTLSETKAAIAYLKEEGFTLSYLLEKGTFYFYYNECSGILRAYRCDQFDFIGANPSEIKLYAFSAIKQFCHTLKQQIEESKKTTFQDLEHNEYFIIERDPKTLRRKKSSYH